MPPYDAQAYEPEGTVTASHDFPVGELVWLYESTDGAGYSSETPPTKVGRYKLTISVPDSNPNNQGRAEFTFAIWSKGGTGSNVGSTITQAIYSGQKTAIIQAASGSPITITPSDLALLNDKDMTLNIAYPGLEIGLNPDSLPQPAAGGSLEIRATPITDPGALNTLYLMTPEGRKIGVGYTVTINQVQNGSSSSVTQLNGEITLTFELSAEDLEGIDPASLVVYKVDDSGKLIELGGQYQASSGESSNRSTVGTITVSTSHLCQFFISGKVAKERLQGADRYLTAAAISQKGWEKADNVILASGENYADALTGAVLAGVLDAPVLLTGKAELSAGTLKEIQRLQAKNIFIIGGTGVISAQVEAKLKEGNYNVQRLQGTDRFSTAVAVGERIKEESGKAQKNMDTVILATGLSYPDALSIAPFAAREGIPILFSSGKTLIPATKEALTSWGIQKVILVGGTGAIAATVEEELTKDLSIQVQRLSGMDRYLTALAIAKHFAEKQSYVRVVMATGENFADALAGASFAAKYQYPVLLTGKKETRKEVLDYIGNLEIDLVYILGGKEAIPEQVKDGIY